MVQRDSKRAANSISSRNWRDFNHFAATDKDVIGAGAPLRNML
jgi:hypothetical protein